MYQLISNHIEINRRLWGDFVMQHPHGNIFQTPEMVDLYITTPKFEPLVIACLDEQGTIAGILVAVIQLEYEGILKKLTSRSIIWGGPLARNEDTAIVSLILAFYDKQCGRKAIYSQFRNLWDCKELTSCFSDYKYIYEDHLDILFDLKKGKEALWNEMSASRRKQIKKGMRNGIEIRLQENLSEQELNACYSILSKVYNKVKLPFPELIFFRNSLELLSGMHYFQAVMAVYKDEIIGFRFFLAYKGLLYDWYAGSLEEHYDKYPNDILPWEILNWGAESGMEVFDFGGAGKPGLPYGVRDYKLKFGGSLVNFGRFEKSHKPILMFTARIGFKVWKLLK